MAYALGKLLVMNLAATVKKCNQTTLKSVCSQVNISEAQYNDWLKGVTIPTKEEIELICKNLDYPISEFYEEIKKNGGNLAEIPSAGKTTKTVTPTEKESSAPEKKAEKAETPDKKAETPDKKEPVKKSVAEKTEKEDFPMPKPVEVTPTKTEKQETKTVEPKKPNVSSPKKKPVEKTEEKKKEIKTMDQSVTAETKPKATRAKKQAELKALTPEMEAKLRKVMGLKKTDPVDGLTVEKSLDTIKASILESFAFCEELTKTLTNSFETAAEAAKIDPRYVDLLEAAQNASDEGISVALTILKQFKK